MKFSEIVALILFFIIPPIIGFLIYKQFRSFVSLKRGITEYFMISLAGFSVLLFLVGLSTYSSDFNLAIDPVDNGYTPFATKHMLTLFLFFYGGHICCYCSLAERKGSASGNSGASAYGDHNRFDD